MRNTVTFIAIAAAALTLGACGGGATVDNEDVPPTVAPLAKPTKSVTSVEATEASTSKAKPADVGAGAAAPAPRDEPAQEVSAIPTAPVRSDQEERFLEELNKRGIKVEGVEDQMVSVAEGVCANTKDELTLGAVSGQIVEQKRTDKKPNEVADILVKTAKEAYC